jgi:glycosyltransferase involved in cell wall biosynthesis
MKKLVFIFSGLPHYFNFILNSLQNEFEVHVIVPKSDSINLGRGVLQDNKNITFYLHEIELEKKWYGKYSFYRLEDIVASIKPNAIIFTWPYILEIVFNKKLREVIKKDSIKVGLKEIPFQVPKSYNIFELLNGYVDENGIRKSFFKRVFLGIGVLALRLVYYNKVDFTLNYLGEALDILPTYGLDKSKIFVTLNSIETQKIFDTVNELEGTLVEKNTDLTFIHVGRLVKWKNVHLLLMNFEKLYLESSKSVSLIIVGDGPEYNELIKLANSLSSRQKISFEGQKYGIELYKLLLRSHVYVLAGAGGLSINEAMCLAKPIICSRADGTEKYLVKNSINGFIVNNHLEFYEKMSFFVSNPDKIEEFGSVSKKIIQNEVNEKIVIENYKIAFRSIL